MDSYIVDEELYFDSCDYSDEQWDFINELFEIPITDRCSRIIVRSHEVVLDT